MILFLFLPLLASLSLLQSSAVTEGSERGYDWHVQEFATWMKQTHQAPAHTVVELDGLLTTFFDSLFLEGTPAGTARRFSPVWRIGCRLLLAPWRRSFRRPPVR